MPLGSEGPPTATVDLTGRTLLGKYEIVSLLGAGGMGSVWHAKHTLTGRKLAVKLLDESYLKNKKVVSRFQREARAASAVQHPGVVEVLDIDQTDEGVPFMVMEFLEGEMLATRIEKRGRLDQEEMIRLGSMLLEALEAAHAHGVIHRDLKPENIFVVPAGRRGEMVKILDFGISHMHEDDGKKLTMTGSVLGTPHYMSPEQAMGDVTVDHRADLYAMGVVLYEMAVGDVPFDAPNYNKLLRIILDEDPPPPKSRGAEISDEVERVIQWAMSKEVEDRISTAAEMKAWLHRAAKGEMPPFEPKSGAFLVREAPIPVGGSSSGGVKAARGTPPGARPAGTLPANRGVASMLTSSPSNPSDSWRPAAMPATMAEESPAEAPEDLEWDFDGPSASPSSSGSTSLPRSTPPPSLDDPLSMPPPAEASGIELDESAMRPRSLRPSGPAPRPTPVTGSGPNRALSSSSAGQVLAVGPSSMPPRTSVPPRVGTLSGEHAIAPGMGDLDDDGGPAWPRYLLAALVALAAFGALVFFVNRVVSPGVDDDEIDVSTHVPDPSPTVERPSTPAWVSIRIVGIPPEGQVELDGLPAGSTVRVRQGGTHVLQITAPGYEPRRIELEADRNRTIHARMVPAEGTVQGN